MGSRLYGAPLSAAEMTTPPPSTISGIRAPLTLDMTDSDYSVSPRSRVSYYSGSEVDSEGFLSGEDELDAASERPYGNGPSGEILEKTQFVEESAFSRPIMKNRSGENVQESSSSSSSNENDKQKSGSVGNESILRPILRKLDGTIQDKKESGGLSRSASFRPLVRVPSQRIYKGGGNENDSDDSRTFSSESDGEIFEDKSYVLKRSDSRPSVTLVDEEVSENEPVSEEIKILPVKRLNMPIAQVSAYSDDDSDGSDLFVDNGVSSVARVPSIEVLQRLNSNPRARISDFEEGEENESQGENNMEIESVGDLVEENESQFENKKKSEVLEDELVTVDVSYLKDEKEPVDAEDANHFVISADLIQDAGPDAHKEARASSLVTDEKHLSISELEQNENLMSLDEGVLETDVIDDSRSCVDLAHHVEPSVLTDSAILPGNISQSETVDELEKTRKFEAVSLDDGDERSNILGDSDMVFDQDIESMEKIDQTDELLGNMDLGNGDSVDTVIDLKELLTEDCTQLSEFSEVLTKTEHFDMDNSLLKDASSGDAENNDQLSGERDNSTFDTDNKAMVSESESKRDPTTLSGEKMLQNHVEEIDGLIPTDSDEGVNTDGEKSGHEQVIDSTELAAFLNAVSGATSDDNVVDFTSLNGTEKYIVEERSPENVEPPTTNGELERILSAGEKQQLEKIKQIGIKYLRLLHRRGHSPEDSVAAKVLDQLKIAQARYSSQAFCCDLDVEHEAQTKNDLDFSLRILVIGKTGVGKSATINSIFGEKKTVINAFEQATTKAKEINGTIDGVKIKVFDTPGLSFCSMNQSINRKVLLSIKKLMQKSPPDVILYVDRLDTQTNDLPVLKLLTSYLGPSIWRKTVIALTHANSLPPDGPDGNPLESEVYVAQKSQDVQKLISLSSGDVSVLMDPSSMIPVSLVENHPFARDNVDEESWRSQLMFLCCSIKTLSEVSTVVSIYEPLNKNDRRLEPSSQSMTRPLYDSHAWDLDCGYDGVLIEDKFEIAGHFPTAVSVHVKKDKREFNLQLHSSVLVKHQDKTSLGLSIARYRGEFVWGCNLQSLYTAGGKSRLHVRAGLNNKLSVQMSVKTSCSDQLQNAALALLPLAKAIIKKLFPQSD